MSLCNTCTFSPNPCYECPHITRYLRVVRWAERRYTIGGRLVVMVGNSPTRYERIARAAWSKYMA